MQYRGKRDSLYLAATKLLGVRCIFEIVSNKKKIRDI
jgi:hypothetical protein